MSKVQGSSLWPKALIGYSEVVEKRCMLFCLCICIGGRGLQSICQPSSSLTRKATASRLILLECSVNALETLLLVTDPWTISTLGFACSLPVYNIHMLQISPPTILWVFSLLSSSLASSPSLYWIIFNLPNKISWIVSPLPHLPLKFSFSFPSSPHSYGANSIMIVSFMFICAILAGVIKVVSSFRILSVHQNVVIASFGFMSGIIWCLDLYLAFLLIDLWSRGS